ncbi:hypothetical protein [Phenylobacterium sp.]|jgi:hypothetical protein|uniref:hypothetical protein n=1 Tax=Phenylobacterium sp. TaxID=1871053 RepID=UPI002F95C522
MIALALALALFAQDAASAAEAPAAAPAENRLPAGAPADDYQFVAWCYGALRGYIDLHDEVMPEVTRIEAAFRPPGRKLADDLKVYDDQMVQGRKDLARFQAALTAAERASLQPINTLGAQAVRKGRSVWNAGPDVTKARKAQEWMSWTLPARCVSVADALEARAKLMGASFKVNAEPAPAAPAEAPAAPAEPAAPGL